MYTYSKLSLQFYLNKRYDFEVKSIWKELKSELVDIMVWCFKQIKG